MMDDNADKPNERMERLLRQWGADEAARTHSRELPRAPRVRRFPLPEIVAVAAILLLSVSILLPAWGAAKQGADAPVRSVHVPEQQAAPVEPSDLAQRFAASEAELLDLRQQLRQQQELHSKTIDSLAQAESERARVERLATELAATLEQAQALADRAVAAADSAIAARVASDAELTALRAQHEANLRDLQHLYIAAMGGARQGIAARQHAARANSLLDRVATAGQNASQGEAAEVLDSLEVVLTQLDMLDPHDVRSVRAFAELTQRSDIVSRIDSVLLAGDQPQHVQALLREARLILMEIDHAA